MKKLFLLFLLIIGFQLGAKNSINALFGVNSFKVSGKSPYIETYLLVQGAGVKSQLFADGKYRGSVNIQITIKKDEALFYIDKYALHSPEVLDSLHVLPNFFDQQRITIPNGKYMLELELSDASGESKPLRTSTELDINYHDDKVQISDINLIENFSKASQTGPLTKNGLDLMPHISSFYASGDNRLIFYTEVYATSNVLGEEQKFLVNYFLEDHNSSKSLNNYASFKKFTTAPTVVLLQEFDISNLATGNYNLVIEVKDKENNTIDTKRCFFQRSNPGAQIAINDLASVNVEGTFADRITGVDSLIEYIRCLRPISTALEQQFGDNQLKTADVKMMQQFIYSFWHNRNSSDPEQEWLKYKAEVKKVNKEFSTLIKRGYMTDRGRVYLQYGPPDTRAEAPREPSAYPYEVWHYYKLKNQNNRRFVFYNPDLITNDYELIHSTANGEIFDERWHLRILKRDTQSHDLDMENGSDHYGTRVRDLYLNPR